MAVKPNTVETYALKGIREDLADLISNISPTQTPFYSLCEKRSAKNTFFEWQLDSLVAPVANAVPEGDDIEGAYDAIQATTRVGTYCQISRKSAQVSGTADEVRKAGRDKEMDYQVIKKGKELRRDLEYTMVGLNQACVAGASGTARKTGSLLAWVKTNVSMGATGANPVYTTQPNATRGDGTQRDISETLLRTVLQLCYTNGAEPTLIMAGAVNKQNISTKCAGIAAQRFNAKGNEPSTIVGAADIYVSDYGNLSIVPNRFQRDRDVWIIDPDMCAFATLRNFRTYDMAKTGDSTKKMVLIEWGFQMINEAGVGLVADLTTVQL